METTSIFLHLLLFVGCCNLVNSKSSNQSNNATKGIIRHQQTFESKLNHLVVDNIAGRVSVEFSRRFFNVSILQETFMKKQKQKSLHATYFTFYFCILFFTAFPN